MEQVEFQRILLRVQELLSPAEVLDLTLLCSDLLKQDLGSVTAGRDLFSLLQNRGLLTSYDPSLLIELLQIIKRSSLVRDLRLKMHPQLPGTRISPYRRLLYELQENMSSDDLKNFKFLLIETLPRKKLQQDMTMLQLFLEMEKINFLDADNLDNLEKLIGDICPRLNKLISQFKTEHGAGVIAQETKLRSNSGSLDLSVTIEAVQPESYIQNGDATHASHIQSAPAKEELLPPSFFSPSPPAQMLPSLPTFSGDAARDVEGQMDNLSLRQRCSQVQRPSAESTAEEMSPSCPDQRNQKDLPKLEEYNMKGDWRGFCLIINNYKFSCPNLKDRHGTDKDEKRLVGVFQWLGFETQTVQDCNRTQMLQELEQLRTRDHSQADCVVCCVLTHGYNGGIHGVDGSKVALRELMGPLSGHCCPLLSQKPKLFFIQACQGTKHQEVVFLHSDGLDDSSSINVGISCDAAVPSNSIPSHADFLMALATVPLYTSYRDKVKGTWFIQSLCDSLLQMVPRGVDLLSILTHVNNEVSKKTDPYGTKKQIPQPGFTLRKRVVFPVPKHPPTL
ncbi:caspase-8 [Electrophorus electricus]|uniref:caspase-8 n=1 Tax=Electrophorus electricus TaxID=8005 RepID=UPI0015CF8AE4|nr:caspase-8 [Electrophorus electricus]